MATGALGGIMDYFLSEYKKKCKVRFAKYEFKSYRNNHYRIVDDVFQCFTLHRSQYGNNATVEFSVLPLSQEYIINKSTSGGTHLKKFENSTAWFPYISSDLKSIDECIEHMISYMEKYLIPFFQKSTNCFDAYEALKIFDVFGDIGYNEYPKMIMSLKNKHYLYAKKHIMNIIGHIEYAFKRNKEVLGENLTEEYTKKMEKKIAEKQHLLDLINAEDYDRIQMWLNDNEIRNKQNFGFK